MLERTGNRDVRERVSMSVPKRGKQGPEDSNEIAFRVVRESLGESENPISEDKKNPAAVSLGRLGGLKGGKARAAKLTAEERSAIAKKASNARWNRDE
ncbi:MAG: hypothetical protein JNM34_06425 [Chthonomonadaceae bacterium]|nr:hypothetical protein [Chthonomonadaceae bacterium]